MIICCMVTGVFATAAVAAESDGVKMVKESKVAVTADLIVGSWSAVSPEGHKVKMIFSSDGQVTMVVDGQTKGRAMTTYRFDPTTKPASLDITAKANGQEHTMHGIVSFLTKDKMKVVMAEKRPTDFSGDVLVFHRKRH
jgi:uncharacterized protein (TIGR03067 family)